MKKSLLLPAVLFVAMLIFLTWVCVHAGSQNVSSAVARIYFAGTNSMASDTNSAVIENIFGCPQARALESQTLDKLSHAPGVWFKNKLPPGADDGSAQLRPLLDDFLKSEWKFEMRQTPAAPEYALAIRLDATRAQLWLGNLRSLLEAWTKINAQDIPGGWELRKDMPAQVFRIVRAGDWVVVGCGQGALPLSEAWSQGEIAQNETNWLSAELDWPRLAQIFPAFATFDFPKIEVRVTEVARNLKLTGKFDLSRRLPPLENWEIPTNMIHPPISSFTAVRGLAPWLENQHWERLQALSPLPDQAFAWCMGGSALQMFMAVPVPNATNALAQLERNLTANTNWQNDLVFPLGMSQTADTITWQNLPYFQPEITAISSPVGDYLAAGLSPNLPQRKPLPRGLLKAINRDNLVFYHWEITPERLAALPQLTQLALMMTNHKQLGQGEAAAQWLNHIGPMLGNCVTEVSQTGPSELSFVRTGAAGLTAIELIALANWLEAPNFPGCDLSLPPSPVVPHHKHHKKLMAPAPSAAR
jgi:hypothetical protein